MRKTMRKTWLMVVAMLVLCGSAWLVRALAQNNEEGFVPLKETEIFKIGVGQISQPFFDPAKHSETVITGEAMFVTKTGTFSEPEFTCEISGANITLPVSLSPLEIEMLPQEYKDLAKRWAFTVRWNGKDKDGLSIPAGRYDVVIKAKVLKTEKVKEKNAQGEASERIVEVPCEDSTTAPIVLIRE